MFSFLIFTHVTLTGGCAALFSVTDRAALLYLAAVQCFLFLYLRMSRLPVAVRHSFLSLTARHSFICQPCGAFFSYIYTFVYTDGDAALAYLPRSYPPAAAWYSLIRRRRSCRFYCQCSVANTSVGNRPCRYYRSPAPKGRAGFIFNTPATKSPPFSA